MTLISIGLSDERDLSLRGLEEAKKCDSLYAELYTTVLDTDINRLSALIGKPVEQLSRSRLEEDSDILLNEAARHRVGVLVGGDTLSATTHISLILDAHRRCIKTNIVHGSSILTAIAETGLSLYKFGRTVTIPLPEKGSVDTVMTVLEENKEHGLHTLLLLDLNPETGHPLTLNRAISLLLNAQRSEAFNSETLAVGVARLGWGASIIKAGEAADLTEYEFGVPPHVLIVPGNLHFLEAQALKIIAGCPKEAIEGRCTKGELERLVEKYSADCSKALDVLRLKELPKMMTGGNVKALIEHADRYLKDAEYYANGRKVTSLASVCYTEGILDALRLLGLVDFEW